MKLTKNKDGLSENDENNRARNHGNKAGEPGYRDTLKWQHTVYGAEHRFHIKLLTGRRDAGKRTKWWEVGFDNAELTLKGGIGYETEQTTNRGRGSLYWATCSCPSLRGNLCGRKGDKAESS